MPELAEVSINPGSMLPIGVAGDRPVCLNLDKILAGRCLVQGSSGAGKSHALRKIIEEAFDFLTTMIVDPEGEFENLAAHIGATTIRANELATDGLTALALRARHHRLPLHLDLSDLTPEERILKAAAFFAGLVSCPKEDWGKTILVAIDEAHLLAPHVAASTQDAEVRRLGVSSLAELCSRGRKRGIASIVATQRLAKLAASVTSELQSALIGLNVFDRDVARAADILGFSRDQAERLKRLAPGEFYAFGPALSWTPLLTRIDQTVTRHTGATPEIQAPADLAPDETHAALDVEGLRQLGEGASRQSQRGGVRALDAFLLDPAAAPAIRILEALRPIAPNATTSAELQRHLGLEPDVADDALDLLGAIGAVDTIPKGDGRICRLSPRLRLKSTGAPVVGLS